MALRAQPIVAVYRAWNTVSNQPQTADASNHTLHVVGDGATFTPAASPVEIGATPRPGYYSISLQASEMNYNFVDVGGVSSTANVILIGPQIVTERGVLPNVPPTTQGQPLTSATNAPTIVHAGTCPNPGTNTTILLDALASSATDLYKGCSIRILSGTGAGQQRVIAGYAGSSRTATVDWAWAQNPDATSVFAVVFDDAAALNASLQPSVSVTVTGTVNANIVSYAAGLAPDALVWAYKPISTRTAAQLLRYAAATSTGAVTGAGTGTPALFDTDAGTTGTPMVQYTTTDANGSRTVVVNS